MKRAIFSVLIILFACLMLQGAAFADDDDDDDDRRGHSSGIRASKDIKNAGEIVGVVNFCGPQGTNGSVVDLVARSFSSVLGVGGEFNLQYVPAGAYTLRVRIPNQPEHTQPVTVVKRRVTDIGLISICGDNDGDGFTPDISNPVTGNDCNDNNALIFPGATEFCDGVDNDCDGNVDGDGCAICSDLDNDGFFAQDGCGTTTDCDDSSNTVRPNGEDLCDGVDNNCDGAIDEDFNLNTDPNNCGECARVCSSGQCGDGICLNECGNGLLEAGEQCDDGNIDSGDGCDALCVLEFCGDSIVNNNGVEECDDGNTVSGDGCQADCSLPTACSDGTPDGGTRICDGPDSDSCTNGTQTCTNGVFGECVETITDINEVCNGIDDDCDDQVDEDFPEVGQTCNVGQGACERQGTIVCSANGTDTQCSAVPGAPQFESCNGIDDNCDGQVDEGTEAQCNDGNICTSDSCSASGGCVNSPVPAGTACGSDLSCDGAGACVPDLECTSSSQCSSPPNSSGVCESDGTCGFTCSNGFADCDGNPQNGCEVLLNSNPSCASPVFLGTVSGDTGSQSLTNSSRGEKTFRIRVDENDSGLHDLGVRVFLSVPQGTDYDLRVRCDSCGGSLRTSTNRGSTNETVFMRWDEETILGFPTGSDSSRDLIIEVIFVSGSACGNWQLSVQGNILSGPNTCSTK